MSQLVQEIASLKIKVSNAQVPEELEKSITLRLGELEKMVDHPSFLPQLDSMRKYINWVASLPWSKRTEDNLDLIHAKQVLDSNHHGLEEIKNRIIEYMSVMRLRQQSGEQENTYRAPILCFVGLVGTGKTTIASSIAQALGRKFARIPFGGMGDPLELRGQSRMHPESEPGKVIKALRDTGAKNCVILLDEIDRVTQEGRSSIMGVLVELLDPGQNKQFTDHYLDFPFDLSEVLFIATANNTHNIATAVLDRLEPISMPSYTDEEKITIGKNYILPRTMKLAGLPQDSLAIDDSTWPMIVRPLGFDAGIRTLERTIDGVVRKAAREIVEGKSQAVVLTPENIKQYLPG